MKRLALLAILLLAGCAHTSRHRHRDECRDRENVRAIVAAIDLARLIVEVSR